MSVAAPEIDYDRLTRAILTARPIAGVINVQPHNYDEWVRQQENLTRAAAIGGLPR